MEETNTNEKMTTEIRELIPIEEAVKLFESAKKPPSDALKPIEAGKLKGKNEISPLWRMEKMTDMFGQYGNGWKIEIIEKWKEPIESTKEVIIQVAINLYTRNRHTGEWNAPSPAIGSAYLIVKDKNGLHGNENAWASAVTDAIGKACKPFGIGYDVYLGKTNKDNQNNNRNQPINYNNNYNNRNNYNNNYRQQQQQRPVQQTPAPQANNNQQPAIKQTAPNQAQQPVQKQTTQEEQQQNELMKKNAFAKIQHTVEELKIPYADVTTIIRKLFNKNKTTELTTPEMIALSNNLESNWRKLQQEKAKVNVVPC